MATTRRQHYVAQMYLRAWARPTGKAHQLWCLRRSTREPFLTDTKNVAQERDFYRLTPSLPDDAQWVRSVAALDKARPGLRKLNEGWIQGFETFWKVQRLRDRFPANPRLIATLDRSLIEMQESAYAAMEAKATGQLAQLRMGNNAFFEDDDQAVSFIFFLISQYFRTKKIKDAIRRRFSQGDVARFDRTWPIFRYIFATNIGSAVFLERKKAPLQVVRAPAGLAFITSDQPVINTHAAFVSETKPLAEEEFELYYPVSPTHAVIISSHSVYERIHGQELTPFHAQYLNQAIEQMAHEQLFASTANELLPLAQTFT